MHTAATSSGTTDTGGNHPVSRVRATQKVLIVNGSSDVLAELEPVLDAGNYDVVFVEASGHAYSQIKRVQPNLVILCVEMDDPNGLNVLSMLKLDSETRDIPVVTFTGTVALASEVQRDDGEPPMFTLGPASLMN